MTTVDKKAITFSYKNWRGETSRRTVRPMELWFGSSEWHPQEQWFLHAMDLEKGEERDFALVDILFEKS